MIDDPRQGHTSASNAASDFACPGRHLAQRGLKSESSEYATSGTAVHAALATGDASKLTLAEHDTYEACRTIVSRLASDYFGPNIAPTLFVENRMWTRFMADDKKYAHSGQVDVALRSGTRALVVDYKSLSNEAQESPKNLQLRDIAVLVGGNLRPVSEVAVAIVQPLVTHSPEVTSYTEEDLVRAEAEMQQRIVRSNDPNSPRVAGKLQCEHCLAKSKCDSYSAWVGSMIPIESVQRTNPVVHTQQRAQVADVLAPAAKASVQQTFSQAMEVWTPQQRAQVADVLAPAAKALEQMKEFLKSGMEKDADFVPGWELKEGNKIESVVDPQACFERFLAIGGKQEKFMEAVKVGKTRFREKVSESTGKKGKSLDSTMKELLSGITETSQNAPSLARKKDQNGKS